MLRICTITLLLLGGNIAIGNSTPPEIKLNAFVEGKVVTIQDRINNVLIDSGYSRNMRKVILAKADFESGTFKNDLTKDHNNVFSMLHSKYDPYSKCGCGYAEGRKGYASYPTIEDQVYAYIWYTKKKHYPKEATMKDYVRFMKSKGYFEANEKKYLNGLLSRIDKYKDIQ